MEFVVFRLDRQRFAIPLPAVERIIHAVEVTPLPGAPAIVMGAINIEGRILPVLNIRRRFLLPERDVDIGDHFLIGTTTRRQVVLAIDEAEGVIDYEGSAVTDVADVAPGVEHFDGVMRLESGLVLIHDLEKFLSLDESRLLDALAAPNH